MKPTLQVLDIIKQTGADGPGVRNVLYVAGCRHHCPGCHNPESWDYEAGRKMDIDAIADELIDDYSGITISGGDPFEQSADLAELLVELRIRAPHKSIWVYTGYTYEELMTNEYARRCLCLIDVLVDGPYVRSERDLSRFCGSSNQRILHLDAGKIVAEE